VWQADCQDLSHDDAPDGSANTLGHDCSAAYLQNQRWVTQCNGAHAARLTPRPLAWRPSC